MAYVIKDLREAARRLFDQEVVAFPTETVYGLGALATSHHAVKEVFRLKNRPTNHPLIMHVSHPRDIHVWGRNITPEAFLLARAFWPGPLTLIVPKSEYVLDSITGGQDAVAIRMPENPLAWQLIDILNTPIVGPSANPFGAVSPTSAEHVVNAFPGADFSVLDGGECVYGLESTIVDVRLAGHPRVARWGALDPIAIATVLDVPVALLAQESDLRVPGQIQKHYAPKARLEVLPRDKLLLRAQNWAQSHDPVHVLWLGESPELASHPQVTHHVFYPDPQLFGQAWFAWLHAHNHADAVLLVEAPPQDWSWRAVWDRLKRASYDPVFPG